MHLEIEIITCSLAMLLSHCAPQIPPVHLERGYWFPLCHSTSNLTQALSLTPHSIAETSLQFWVKLDWKLNIEIQPRGHLNDCCYTRLLLEPTRPKSSFRRLEVLKLSPCGKGLLISTAGKSLSMSSLFEIEGKKRRENPHAQLRFKAFLPSLHFLSQELSFSRMIDNETIHSF